MPSFPEKFPHDGLIRSHDLFVELHEDIDKAYELLEHNKESQYLRRCVVRAIYSYIEAILEIIKIELRSNIRTDISKIELTKNESELLGKDTHGNSLYVKSKNYSLQENLKKTFNLAIKVWEIKDYKLDTTSKEYEYFLESQKARNCLTHPKTFYDIQVSDADMAYHSITYHWVYTEFKTLFRIRKNELLKSLSNDDREAIESLMREA